MENVFKPEKKKSLIGGIASKLVFLANIIFIGWLFFQIKSQGEAQALQTFKTFRSLFYAAYISTAVAVGFLILVKHGDEAKQIAHAIIKGAVLTILAFGIANLLFKYFGSY